MPHRIIYAVKTKFLFAMFSALSFAFALFDKYIFDDWDFLAFLSVAVLADTILGVTIALRDHNFKLTNGFRKIFLKCIIYATFLILTHVLAAYTVHGEKNIFWYWFTSAGYALLMVAESSSILRNINILKPKFTPAWLMKRFAEFNDKGEVIQKLTDNENSDIKS